MLSRIGRRISIASIAFATVNITSWKGTIAAARLSPGACPGRSSTNVTSSRYTPTSANGSSSQRRKRPGPRPYRNRKSASVSARNTSAERRSERTPASMRAGSRGLDWAEPAGASNSLCTPRTVASSPSVIYLPSHCFGCSYRDNHRKERIVQVELSRRQLLGRDAHQKGHRRQDVPMAPNLHRAADEGVAEEARARGRCQTPVLRRELKACDATDRGNRAEQRPAGAQDPVGVPNCRLKLEDVLEGLGEDEAVEELAWNVVGCGQVGDESRRLVRRVDIEHVAPLHGDTEALGVVGVQQLEYPSVDGLPLGLEKRLDVVAVNGGSALAAPMVAERRRPAKRAKPGGVSKAVQPPTPAKRIPAGGRESFRPPTHTRRRYSVVGMPFARPGILHSERRGSEGNCARRALSHSECRRLRLQPQRQPRCDRSARTRHRHEREPDGRQAWRGRGSGVRARAPTARSRPACRARC